MDNRRFTLEEFEALFPGRFESREQLLREYRSFLAVFERLGPLPTPELSTREKAEIFRRSWQGRRRDWFWIWTRLEFSRRSAVAFVLGMVLGGAVVFGAVTAWTDRIEPGPRDSLAATEPAVTVEHIQRMQVYRGKAIERLYPDIENPAIVLEKTQESSVPRRVLYGTLDDGEVYVVWNL